RGGGGGWLAERMVTVTRAGVAAQARLMVTVAGLTPPFRAMLTPVWLAGSGMPLKPTRLLVRLPAPSTQPQDCVSWVGTTTPQLGTAGTGRAPRCPCPPHRFWLPPPAPPPSRPLPPAPVRA